MHLSCVLSERSKFYCAAVPPLPPRAVDRARPYSSCCTVVLYAVYCTHCANFSKEGGERMRGIMHATVS